VQQRSGYISTILDDLDPVVFTERVSGCFVVSFGNEHGLFVKRHIEVTNDNFILQTDLVQLLLVDFISKVDLSLHKEQDLIDFVILREKYFLRIDSSGFQTLEYS